MATTKREGYLRLNNGTTSEGTLRTTRVKIANLATGAGYTESKYSAFIEALLECLSLTLYAAQTVTTDEIV